MAIQFWESKRYRSPSTVSSIDASFFIILPHNAQVTSLWKLIIITLEQLPNNSINLFKDITKIEELVQIIHRIFMI
jgi:hypothetical protein